MDQRVVEPVGLGVALVDQDLAEPFAGVGLFVDPQTFLQLVGGDQPGVKENLTDAAWVNPEQAMDEHALAKVEGAAVGGGLDFEFAGEGGEIDQLKDVFDGDGRDVALHAGERSGSQGGFGLAARSVAGDLPVRLFEEGAEKGIHALDGGLRLAVHSRPVYL